MKATDASPEISTVSARLSWKHGYQPSLLCMCTEAEISIITGKRDEKEEAEEANTGLYADAELNT